MPPFPGRSLRGDGVKFETSVQTQIGNAFGFGEGTRQRALIHYFHLDASHDALVHLHAYGTGKTGVVAGRETGKTFHLQPHVIKPLSPSQFHMVFAAHFGETVQHVGDLSRIDVHAAENNHIV